MARSFNTCTRIHVQLDSRYRHVGSLDVKLITELLNCRAADSTGSHWLKNCEEKSTKTSGPWSASVVRLLTVEAAIRLIVRQSTIL